MTYTKWPFTASTALCTVLLALSSGPLKARDADPRLYTIAAARTAKQQCINACGARYRDCRHLNQLPSSECKGIYQDCARYSTGLGPG